MLLGSYLFLKVARLSYPLLTRSKAELLRVNTGLMESASAKSLPVATNILPFLSITSSAIFLEVSYLFFPAILTVESILFSIFLLTLASPPIIKFFLSFLLFANSTFLRPEAESSTKITAPLYFFRREFADKASGKFFPSTIIMESLYPLLIVFSASFCEVSNLFSPATLSTFLFERSFFTSSEIALSPPTITTFFAESLSISEVSSLFRVLFLTRSIGASTELA